MRFRKGIWCLLLAALWGSPNLNLDHMETHRPSPMITYAKLPEATTNLSQLLDRVRQGEEVIISQSGQPLAKPPETGIAHSSPPKSDRIQPTTPRVPGQYASQFTVPDDFNAPLPDDILETFLLPVEQLSIL
jgi:antitoxin (DNA-binding transcriptional repressor) of toxin-antitoxin stability system